jgi:tetratricopeptide (TPR) repeat protein
MEQDEDFDGIITRYGELVSIRDTERVSALGNAVGILWRLAEKCQQGGHYRSCREYIEKILPLLDSPEAKTECLLRMGIAMENERDYEAAYRAYARAFDLPQEPNDTWYFLNNNRGYCLNQIGRYFEAEKYCRAAIQIDRSRYNAHKNLGVALAGQGRCAEAAKEFIRATRLCPSDSRALALLDILFAENRDAVDEIPSFRELLIECHELVRCARGESLLQ